MNSPLSPTANDVRKLDDVQLRQFLIRLVEAELRLAGRPLAGVTAGGDQNAADGGLDLRVTSDGAGLDFLPAFPVGIQVKAELMSPGKVEAEIRLNGRDRQSIADLAAAGGTYVIASGRDSCSHEMQERRLERMRAAVQTLEHADRLTLDFYDADRLSRWASRHPGVSAWLLEVAGRPARGWSGWEAWSSPNAPSGQAYLEDATARAHFEVQGEGCNAQQAIVKTRALLAEPRKAVRLVGLSGMGKTRFAEALFDERIGTGGLSPALAVYADIGAALEVSPSSMAGELVDRRVRAVLIVDNCPAEEHRRLQKIIDRVGSQVSLLTIDFDIADGRLPETTTLRFDPAGDAMIANLLVQRHPELSRPDSQRIVLFAGGNSRIALVLAGTAHGETLAALDDEQLLDRLFLTQRRQPDETLHKVAEAAALVSAIVVDPTEELTILASLARVEVEEFYAKLRDLQDRGLAQQRGKQRAILPHALAARLAERALTRAMPGVIEERLVHRAPERLRDSFLKRLGLLHKNQAAVAIAGSLLAPGQMYAVDRSSGTEAWDGLANLAPLQPRRALELVAAVIKTADPVDVTFKWLLRDKASKLLVALGYEPDLFDGVIDAMIELSSLQLGANHGSIRRYAATYFQVVVSGTMAAPSDRFAKLRALLGSPNPVDRDFGLEALVATLQVRPKGQELLPTFGARPRSQGWIPADNEECRAWFKEAIDLATSLEPTLAEQVMPQVADALEEMAKTLIAGDLAVSAFYAIAAETFWRDGWFAVSRAVRSIRRGKGQLSDDLMRLEEDMRPRSDEDEYAAWIEGKEQKWREPYSDEVADYLQFDERQRSFGRALNARREARLKFVGRAIGDRAHNARELGQGLALGASDLEAGWAELLDATRSTSPDAQNVSVLIGYLERAAQRDLARAKAWLADASSDRTLRPWVVSLEAAVAPIGVDGAERILASLEAGEARTETFSDLQYGARTHSIPNELLSRILCLLVRLPGGLAPAVDVLGMRFHDASEVALDESLLSAGLTVLAAVAAGSADGTVGGVGRSYSLETIVKHALHGEAAAATAAALLRWVLTKGPSLSGFEEDDVAAAILAVQPDAGLDAALEGYAPDDYLPRSWLLGGNDDDEPDDRRPIGAVAPEVLKAWVEHAPVVRAPFAARHVAYFVVVEDRLEWTQLALWLMTRSGAEAAVLAQFETRFHSGSFHGGIENRYRKRLALVERLVSSDNPAVREWAVATAARLRGAITNEQERERRSSEQF